MKATLSLSLIFTCFALLANPAYAEKAPQQHRVNKAAPRTARTKPPANAVSPTPNTSAAREAPSTSACMYPMCGGVYGIQPKTSEGAGAKPPTDTPLGYQALTKNEKVMQTNSTAERSADPSRSPPTDNVIVGNKIGVDSVRDTTPSASKWELSELDAIKSVEPSGDNRRTSGTASANSTSTAPALKYETEVQD